MLFDGNRWHAGIMTIALYPQLTVLALIDSTSIGTLLIPLWLLLRPDARRMLPRILLYLGVLAAFYLLVGIATLSGAGWALRSLETDSLLKIPVIQWAMVIGGGALLAYSLRPDPAKKRAKLPAVARTVDGGSGTQVPGSTPDGPVPDVPVQGEERLSPHLLSSHLLSAELPRAELKWQQRLSKALRSRGGVVGLALVAGLLELPTMVPYLVAIGFLSNSTLTLPDQVGLLIGYCLVMLVPALLLLGLRVAAGARLDPFMQRISTRMGKFSAETVLWVLGIIGFLLLRGGLSALAPTAGWNPFK